MTFQYSKLYSNNLLKKPDRWYNDSNKYISQWENMPPYVHVFALRLVDLNFKVTLIADLTCSHSWFVTTIVVGLLLFSGVSLYLLNLFHVLKSMHARKFLYSV